MQENIQPQINSNQDDEISLKELVLRLKKWWNYLFSKWLIIVLTGILGGLAGFVYALIKKPIYIAELTFALEEDNGGSLGAYAGLASQFGIDLGGGTGGIFSGDNIIELMKSRSMIQKHFCLQLLLMVNLNLWLIIILILILYGKSGEMILI